MPTAQTAPAESDSSQRNTPPSCVLEMSGAEADNMEEEPHIKSWVCLQTVIKKLVLLRVFKKNSFLVFQKI